MHYGPLARFIHSTQPSPKRHTSWLDMTFGVGDRRLAEMGSIILVMSYLLRGAKKTAVNYLLLERFVQRTLRWTVWRPFSVHKVVGCSPKVKI